MFKIIFVFTICTLFIHVLLFQKLAIGLKKESLIQKRKFRLFFSIESFSLNHAVSFFFFLNEKEPLATIKKKSVRKHLITLFNKETSVTIEDTRG